MENFVRYAIAFAPETRTSAMAPSPGGVEMAAMVSETVIILAEILPREETTSTSGVAVARNYDSCRACLGPTTACVANGRLAACRE